MDYELKSSNAPFVVFIIFILIMVGTVGFLKLRKAPTTKTQVEEKKETIKREIEYYTKGYYYEISQNNQKFDIVIKSDQECEDKEHCNPTRVDNYKVTEQKEIDDLYKLFDELFENKDTRELKLKREDITLDQATVLEYILREPVPEIEMESKILEQTEESGIKQFGYIVENQEDGKVIVTIAMGEQTSTGHSIEIEKMKGSSNYFRIEVKENHPTGEVTGQVMTTPAIKVELNVLPTTLMIVSDSGKIYKEIKQEEEQPKETEEYQIIGSQEYSKFNTRGFVVNQVDDKTLVTIAMGEQSTGGYNISVTKIDIKNNNVVIHVEEKYPSKDGVVTQAFSQPIVQIAFAKKPDNIVVINQNGQKINQIENER